MNISTTELSERAGLPDALRVLLAEFPRDSWHTHSNFRGMVQFWLDRHMMFRRLLALLEQDFQRFADGGLSFDTYAPRLQQYGSMMLNELHGHHQIEDIHYFPKLVALDTRLEDGFALLDRDHHALDAVIHGMAEGANGLLRDRATGTFESALGDMAKLLDRHLEDEEDLIVPVILKTGFEG